MPQIKSELESVAVKSGIIVLCLVACLVSPLCVGAQNTYYISSSTGSDSYDGLSKTFTAPNHGPWAHAPGMNSATTNSTGNGPANYGDQFAARAGDRMVFKGCDVWTNANFTWFIAPDEGWNVKPQVGKYANPSNESQRIYIQGDYDKTWYNTSNCPNGWDRPVLDGCLISAPPQNNLPGCVGNNIALVNAGSHWEGDMIVVVSNYVTISGFEFRNHYLGMNGDKGTGQYAAITTGFQSTGYGIVRNNYYHAFINTAPAITTGTMTQGSQTLTVASTANMQVGFAIQINAINSSTLPFTGNGPVITAINGQNTITVNEAAQDNTCALVACPVQAGVDGGAFFATGSWPNNFGWALEQNVIDGWDTQLVQNDTSCILSTDPNGAEAFTECLGSGIAFWGGSFVRNNVIRYMVQGSVGSTSEYSGNLFEFMRSSANPTQHENAFENNTDPGSGLLFFNNVFHKVLKGVPIWYAPLPSFTTTGTISAGSNILTVASTTACPISPCGFQGGYNIRINGASNSAPFLYSRIVNVSGNTITLQDTATQSASNQTVTTGGVFPTYIFNNVYYDGLRNGVFEAAGNLSYPSMGGTAYVWNNTAEGGPDSSPNYAGASCPSNYQSCSIQNNLFITSSTPISVCGTNCTQSNNVTLTKTQANALGMSATQSYGFQPVSGSLGAGADLSGQCSTVTATGNLSALCADTSFAVRYDTVHHIAVVPGKVPLTRPTGQWQVGAYHLPGSPTTPQSPNSVANTVK